MRAPINLRHFAILAAAVIGLGPLAAHAEPSKGKAPPAAQKTFDAGLEAFKAGDAATALTQISAACDAGHGFACYTLARGFERRQLKAPTPESKLEAFVKGCEAGHAIACKEAAYDYSMSAFSNPDDNVLSNKYRAMACDFDEPISCSIYGSDLVAGKKGLTPDHAKARPYLEKGCKLDMSTACGELALLYAYGRGVGQDAAKAKQLLAKARSLSDDNTRVNDIAKELEGKI